MRPGSVRLFDADTATECATTHDGTMQFLSLQMAQTNVTVPPGSATCNQLDRSGVRPTQRRGYAPRSDQLYGRQTQAAQGCRGRSRSERSISAEPLRPQDRHFD
jgi:hypothetical protein